MEKLIEKMKVDLYRAAMNVNDHIKTNDINRNRTNYGVAITCVSVLNLLGVEADIACWEDAGYLIIEYITINGKKTTLNYSK